MAGTGDLTRLLVAIANLDHKKAVDLLDAKPSLVRATLERDEEFLIAERLVQFHEGDNALHAAGFSYDREMAKDLITRGADIGQKPAGRRQGTELTFGSSGDIPTEPVLQGI